MKSWQIFLTIAVFSGALLYVQDRRQRAAAEQARAEIAELSAAIAQRGVEKEHHVSAQRRAEIYLYPSSFEAPPENRAPNEAKAKEEDAQKPTGPTAEETAMRTEMKFKEQSTDRAWARASELRVSRGLGGILKTPSALRAIECRESLCRLETVHDNDEDLRQLTDKALLGGPEHVWDGPYFTKQSMDSSGKIVATTYLVREGYDLPVL